MTDTDVAPPLSLRVNVLYSAIGRAIYVLTQFATVAVVARLGTTSDVGALTLATAIVTPLFFLTSMGLRDVHTVDDLTHYTRAEYVALRLLGGSIALFLALALAAWLHGATEPPVVMAAAGLALVKFFGAQTSLNHGIFQRAERLDYVAYSHLARGLGGLVVFILAFAATRNLGLALFAEAVAWFLSYFIVDKPLLRRVGGSTGFADLAAIRLGKVAKLFWWLLPVGISLLCLRAGTSAPPIMLSREASLDTVGVFGALAYTYTAFAMTSSTLGGASAARLRRHFRSGDKERFVSLTLRLAGYSALLALLALAAGYTAGEPLLAAVFGREYMRGDLLMILLLAAGIGVAAGPFNIALQAGQAFRRRLLTGMAALIAAWGAAAYLVPLWAEIGAAWSLVAMSSATAIVTLLFFWGMVRGMTPGSSERAR